jgi:hypothetical protein
LFKPPPSLNLQLLEVYQRVSKEIIYIRLSGKELEPVEEARKQVNSLFATEYEYFTKGW